MTTQVATPDQTVSFPPYRPAIQKHGVGRWMRTRIGIDEDALDWSPETRPHYTKVGALVLTTSGLATLSMFAALSRFLDVYWLLLVLPALFWGWVIFCLDSWLIAGTHGSGNAGRVFWVRLLMSVLLGLVIAEPLLLKVFEPDIRQQVMQHDRKVERADRESALKACNPVPFATLDTAALAHCKANGLLLTVSADPASLTDAITAMQSQVAGEKSSLDADQKMLTSMQQKAQRECNGQLGDGLSGHIGDGPRCKQDNRDAETFRKQHMFDARQGQISTDKNHVKSLITQREALAATYAAQVDKAIDRQLPALDGKIGILEADKGLGELASRHLMVFTGSWLVRIMLIVLDCLPIVSKRLSGATPYDRMIAKQLATNEALHEFEDTLRRRRDLTPKQDELSRFDRLDRARQETQHNEENTIRIRQDDELNQKIDAYALRLRGEP
jgi:Domain of unknown function (DUF4407)